MAPPIPSVPPGTAARNLIRAADRASLATAMVEDGWPYVSLVVVACDHAGAPLLLLSDLAEHTKNLRATRGHCALLLDGTQGFDNPLAGPRVTLLGQLAPCADESLLARFLARHPDADTYAGFGDFRLYRMTVEKAHLVSGFGKARWIDGGTLLFDTSGAGTLAEVETEILTHMNDEHRDAVQLYARLLLGLEGSGWRLTGIDPEGADLRQGSRVARLPFDRPVSSPEEARAALSRLVRKARAARRHAG